MILLYLRSVAARLIFRSCIIPSLLIAIFCFSAAAAANSTLTAPPPDWPCIQRYIPDISPGMVWSGVPLPDKIANPDAFENLANLATQRDLSPDDLEGPLTEFIARAPKAQREDVAAALFAVILERINQRRHEVIHGIGIFAQKLRSQLGRIETIKNEIRQASDPSQRRDLDTSLMWENHTFERRETQLTLLCEQPVRLEQRAFALGRILAGAATP